MTDATTAPLPLDQGSPNPWRKALVWLAVMGLVYSLLLAVTMIGSGFKWASGGKDTAESIFAFANNPIAGLILGIFATAVVQSSSTVTSVIVGLVAFDKLDVSQAVPMVMGANIGTTVTNTLVSLAHVMRPQEFRRAFAAATVHDMFNLLAVLIFLPLEVLTGFLRHTSAWITSGISFNADAGFTSPVKLITKPVVALLKGEILLGRLGDLAGGIVLAVLGLVLIFATISFLSRMLRQVLQGRAERIFHTAVGRGPIAGIASGAMITTIVQSSSTTTSLVVPMAGAGVLELEKIFPFTLGANIGTCVTALVASLAGGDNAAAGIQIALVHLLFNLSGTTFIYTIPPLRRIPLRAARALADLAVRNRILAISYILIIFFAIPLALLGAIKLFGDATPPLDPPAQHAPASDTTETDPTTPPAPTP